MRGPGDISFALRKRTKDGSRRVRNYTSLAPLNNITTVLVEGQNQSVKIESMRGGHGVIEYVVREEGHKVEEEEKEQVVEGENEHEELDQFIEYEHVYKIILIGTSAAGKTSLIYRFSNDTFNPAYLNTVGVDLKTVTL